jgi:pentatricopeptide repeat protein
VKALSKKEKLLASAQKNLLKGQVAKAIKDYEKVIECSPDDMRNRQKLGELYSRVGMTAEALETYEAVARHYSKNGFYLKAIAVYKQMQKVDSSKCSVYYRLAELNEKQGLLGNALTEYRQLVLLLRKQDQEKEVSKVLGKMMDIDPDNIHLRLELVDMHARLHDSEQVEEVFGQILEHLKKKDLPCPAVVRQALERYCSDNAELKVALAGIMLDRKDTASSIDLLQQVLSSDAENKNAVLLLADGFHVEGKYRQEQALCKQYLKKNSPDLDVREKSIRANLACGDGKLAFKELESCKKAFFEDQRLSMLKDFYEQLKELFPENETIRESLHAVYEKTGEGGKLFDLMSSGEAKDGIDAKEEIESVEETDSGEEIESPEMELEEPAAYGELPEEEPPVEQELSTSSPPPGSTAASASPDAVSDDNLELEIELEISDSEISPDTFETSHLDFDNLDLEEPADDSALDVDDIIGSLDELDLGKAESVAPVDVAGELEEAKFYLDQGLIEEAESKCRQLLEAVPDCDEARHLLDKMRSKASGGPAEPAVAAKTSKKPVQDRDKSRLDGSLSEFKKGLENQIGAEDTETHYNLGIAYKEMGLFEEAVEQFEKAMLDPSRRVDCLTLKGVCLAQSGEFERAVHALKTGLTLEDLKGEERISFHYELGVVYQTWERPLEALESFQSVAEAEPFFRDVEAKIKALRKELGLDDDGGAENSGSGSSQSRISYI